MKNWIEDFKKVKELEMKGGKITRRWWVNREDRVQIVIREGMKVEKLELEEVEDRGLMIFYRVYLLKENSFWQIEGELGLYATTEEAVCVADKICDEHPEISEYRVKIERFCFNLLRYEYERDIPL